ncbi:MAG TPA: orotate phosphoribosyltransferase [Bacteroidia bacterium]|nr:orotate phosphoribosyltransferase [Bacteroidota bacterium]MBL0051303.1 orotate phosphoribosyltransferase [Bacteroidota bacterium]HRC31829.1 orotate phosphoribosyltransferase [Bacteroidia bacterium]
MIEKDTAHTIAEQLLQIKAIKLQPSEPFTWASGWKSPIYCDNRKSLGYPKIRTFIRQSLAKLIEERFGKPDLIAGVATAAIAPGVLVAEALGLPFCYVRSTPKDHGLKNQIEGDYAANQSCVVIEDLISTGKSSLATVEALRKEKIIVKGMVSIFSYGFEDAVNNFKNANCVLYSLCNYEVLLEEALAKKYIKPEQLSTLRDWRISPSTWMGA